jgi:hypothetical protein
MIDAATLPVRTTAAGAPDQEFLRRAADMGNDRIAAYGLAERYYDGDQGVELTDRLKQYLELEGVPYAENFCETVVDALAERLSVAGIESENEDLATWLQERVWDANEFDDEQVKVLGEATKLGDAFLIAEWDPERQIVALTYNPPHVVRVEYRNAVAQWASKVWDTDAVSPTNPTGRAIRRMNIYWPDRVEKWFRLSSDDAGNWAAHRDEGDTAWPIPWTTKAGEPRGIPVFHFANKAKRTGYGRAEHRGTIPQQNRLNKELLDLSQILDTMGWPQRTATGVTTSELKTAPGEVWEGPAGAAFDQFEAADPTGPLASIEATIVRMAGRSRTPVYQMVLSGDIPSGEALALDTPVQTPSGSLPIGEIAVGDEVFDERGDIQTVEHVFEVLDGRPCYRVSFDDGSSLVADAAHKWLTVDYHARRRGLPGAVVATEQIAGSIKATTSTGNLIRTGRNRTGVYNHAIPVAAALDLPDIDLPIEPYALGVWLGDGTALHADVTQHVDDAPELVANLAAVGVVAHEVSRRGNTLRLGLGQVWGTNQCQRGHARPSGTKCQACEHLTYRSRRAGDPLPPRTNITFRRRLIETELIGNKHIPQIYFRASHRQRLALLQGLMDTDGSTTPGGSVTLDLGRERLARDAHRLIQSLGHKVAIHESIESNYGTPRWRMAWTAPEPVFHLRRKLARQKFATGGASRFRYIRSAEPVESVPVRCIAVSGPSHLFLVGDAYIPTHNSLKTAESGLVSKARNRQVFHGQPLVNALRMAVVIAADEATSDEARPPIDAAAAAMVKINISWADPETRNEKEHLESLALMHELGVSSATILSRIPGIDAEEELEKRAAEDADAAERMMVAFDRGGAANPADPGQAGRQPPRPGRPAGRPAMPPAAS